MSFTEVVMLLNFGFLSSRALFIPVITKNTAALLRFYDVVTVFTFIES
jgi:hypothetical protein